MKLGRRPAASTALVEVLEYVLMLFVFLYSSMWALFTSANCNTFLRLSYPLLAVLIVLRLRGNAVLSQRWKRLVLLIVFLAVYLVATRYNIPRYVLYYFIPLVLLTLYIGLLDDRNACFSLLYKLSNIVIVLSAMSLFFFVFGTCLDLLPSRTALYHWGDNNRTCVTYFHLHYEAQSIRFFGVPMVRNCGLFTEAPGFAVFLTYAAAVEGLLRKKLRLIPCIILFVTALTTLSAKAILLVVMVFGLRYIVSQNRTVIGKRVKMVLVPAVMVAVAFVGYVLIRDKMNSASYHIRLDDVRACIQTWMTKPLFGTGYWNDNSIVPFFGYEGRTNNGLSMGVATLLAQGGVYLLSLYVIPTVSFIRRFRGIDRLFIIAFFITYAALLFTTNMPYSYLAMLIIAVTLECGRKKPNEIR